MRSRFGGELLHPLPLAAAALLALNDHVFKGSGVLPGAVTGKLSDFAGLFVFPVLLFAAVDALSLGRASAPRWRARVAGGACVATAALFVAVKLDPRINAVVSDVLGPMLLDPTDLIALSACALAAAWLTLRGAAADRSRPVPALGALAFVAVAAACLATSAPRLVRNYPAWELRSLGARTLGCARFDLWVSKSGKEGFGVTLELTPSGSCRVAVTTARFSAGGQAYAAASLPEPAELAQKQHVYLPFAFDNEALWNDGIHDGQLELVLDVGDRRERLVLPMQHTWTGPHRIHERGAHSPSQRLQRADASPESAPGFAEPPPELPP